MGHIRVASQGFQEGLIKPLKTGADVQPGRGILRHFRLPSPPNGEGERTNGLRGGEIAIHGRGSFHHPQPTGIPMPKKAPEESLALGVEE